MDSCRAICLMPFTSFIPPAPRRRSLVQHRKCSCGFTHHLLHEPIYHLTLHPLAAMSGARGAVR